MQSADCLGGAVLLAPVVLSVLRNVSALRLQNLSHRSAAVFRWQPGPRHDRQHPRGSSARNGTGDGSRARDGCLCRRFNFHFVAHERGDANRSARVERPFWFIENNFLAGRTFSSWPDLNEQARRWCDRVNSTYKKHIRAVPHELFALEQRHLKLLPVWIPEVYRLHQRTVDVEGYVALHSNRYSVPVAWIGRQVEVRETQDKID